jgi:N-methylhydantoinase B/oxoprolinase/acetone carboxylase alpha subunit
MGETSRPLDPVAFEVIRNALLEVTEEMGVTVRRSAYSTNIKTRADFSCPIFQREPMRCGCEGTDCETRHA